MSQDSRAAQDTPVGTGGIRVDVEERKIWNINGFAGLIPVIGLLVAAGLAILAFIRVVDSGGGNEGLYFALAAVMVGLSIVVASGFVVVEPGETQVVQFFGRYIGTVRTTGFRCTVPLTTRTKVSVKVHNFETAELKVNDSSGNPINIAAIVVWQVADTAKASFAVEDYQDFVHVQSESALRHVAMAHPYDGPDEVTSLRGDTDVIARSLAEQVAERVVIGGVEVVEVRISSLSYAPEIAQAMLQRQQASAVIAARQKIVEGAVGMVEGALERLQDGDIVELDEERKAAMVSNLLVVLCSDRGAAPVVNASSLYH